MSCQHRHARGNRQHRHHLVNCHNLIVIVTFESLRLIRFLKNFTQIQTISGGKGNNGPEAFGGGWEDLFENHYLPLATIIHYHPQ